MASSSESFSVSSLAGRAVTLPKKELEAELGFCAWAWRVAATPARDMAVRIVEAVARRKTKCCARFTFTILSDVRGGAKIPDRAGKTWKGF
jgi:hypothetical protein